MQWNSQLAPARFLLILIVCLISVKAGATPKSLPDAVVHAHSVFLVNETGFHELDYVVILELNKWGHFDLAESRGKTDLILRLDSGNHVRAVPDGQFPSVGSTSAADDSEIPRGHTRISLIDPKTNTVLWSDTHKTEGGKVKSGHLLDGLREAFDSYEKTRR
jgi:hypothetical protein